MSGCPSCPGEADGTQGDAPHPDPSMTLAPAPVPRALSPDPAGLLALARELRAAGPSLRAVPARRVVRALAALHAEWARPRSPLRESAVEAVHAATDYPPGLLDRHLRDLFSGMGAPELEAWLEAAGILPEWLDGLDTTAEGGWAVYGPGLTVVISSGNIPGAALPSVVQSLILKSPCLVRVSAAEPSLLPLYAGSVAEALPELAAGLAVVAWPSGDDRYERPLLAETDALAIYGGEEAVRALRERLPAHARCLAYGHRLSVAAVGRERLTTTASAELAELAAEDFCAFDQQGCLSPQAIYVERGGEVTPEAFAGMLAEAMEAAGRLLPRRSLSPEEAAAIHQFRAETEMRALSDERVRLHASRGGTGWTVVVDPGERPGACPLNRTVVVRPLEDLEALPGLLARYRGQLSTVALAGAGRRRLALAEALAAAGVTRVCGLGQAQHPEGAFHHDGLNAIAALARFVRLERSA